MLADVSKHQVQLQGPCYSNSARHLEANSLSFSLCAEPETRGSPWWQQLHIQQQASRLYSTFIHKHILPHSIFCHSTLYLSVIQATLPPSREDSALFQPLLHLTSQCLLEFYLEFLVSLSLLHVIIVQISYFIKSRKFSQ